MPSSPAKSLDQLAREFYENYINATGGATTGLTNTELRATPVPVGGTVSVGNFPATQPVSGTVALDAASLAALETITAIISGAIALDTATLAALETISVANFPASQAVTGTFFQAVQVTKEARSSTSVATTASITTASATVLAANTNRLGATVYNESGAILYLHLGAAASLTAYTLQVAIGGYYEVPHEFTGILTGITAAGTAVCRVVEVA